MCTQGNKIKSSEQLKIEAYTTDGGDRFLFHVVKIGLVVAVPLFSWNIAIFHSQYF